MDQDFWSRAWESGRTGFHKSVVHPMLQEHGHRVFGGRSHTVFVPLCGQSLDLLWLLEQGHRVVGVELVESAVAGFFETHGLPVERRAHGSFVCWQSGALQVLQGDVFDLNIHPLQERATAVWDRAAMVALPPERRHAYVDTVRRCAALPGARMLMEVFDYDPSELSGPPFRVPEPDFRACFSDCALERLSVRDGASDLNRADRPITRFELFTWLVSFPA